MRNGIDRGIELDSPHPIRQPGDRPDDLSVDDVAHSGGAESVQDEAARLVGESEALSESSSAIVRELPVSEESKAPQRAARVGGQTIRSAANSGRTELKKPDGETTIDETNNNKTGSAANSITPSQNPLSGTDNSSPNAAAGFVEESIAPESTVRKDDDPDDSYAHYHDRQNKPDNSEDDSELNQREPSIDGLDAVLADIEKQLQADQETDLAPTVLYDHYNQDTLRQYANSISHIGNLSEAEVQELSRVIRAGAEVQESFDIMHAHLTGTLDKFKTANLAAQLLQEKKLICERDGKKLKDLTDADTEEAARISETIVNEKIASLENLFKKDVNGKLITTEFDENGNIKPNAVRLGIERPVNDAQAAANKLVYHHLRWALKIANRYQAVAAKFKVDMADVVQAASTGMMKSARTFDPGKGYQFTTYSTYVVIGAITDMFQWEARNIRLPKEIEEKLLKLHKLDIERSKDGTSLNPTEIAARMEMTDIQIGELRRMSEAPYSLNYAINQENGSTTDAVELMEQSGEIPNDNHIRQVDDFIGEDFRQFAANELSELLTTHLTEDERYILLQVGAGGRTKTAVSIEMGVKRDYVVRNFDRAKKKLLQDKTTSRQLKFLRKYIS